MGTGVPSRGQSGRGVVLTTYLRLVLMLRVSRATPLLHLCVLYGMLWVTICTSEYEQWTTPGSFVFKFRLRFLFLKLEHLSCLPRYLSDSFCNKIRLANGCDNVFHYIYIHKQL